MEARKIESADKRWRDGRIERLGTTKVADAIRGTRFAQHTESHRHTVGSRLLNKRAGFMIASNEIPANRRVDFDTTVNAMVLTAREMNAKFKETSEGGLAVSLVLC